MREMTIPKGKCGMWRSVLISDEGVLSMLQFWYRKKMLNLRLMYSFTKQKVDTNTIPLQQIYGIKLGIMRNPGAAASIDRSIATAGRRLWVLMIHDLRRWRRFYIHLKFEVAVASISWACMMYSAWPVRDPTRLHQQQLPSCIHMGVCRGRH
jgi:hypothetical protein